MSPQSHYFLAQSWKGIPSVSHLHHGLDGDTPGPTEPHFLYVSGLISSQPAQYALASFSFLHVPALCPPQRPFLASLHSCSLVRGHLLLDASLTTVLKIVAHPSRSGNILPSEVSAAGYAYLLPVCIFCLLDMTGDCL